jgi:ParB family protein of integrating conjugative element (PFGI_1 class)
VALKKFTQPLTVPPSETLARAQAAKATKESGKAAAPGLAQTQKAKVEAVRASLAETSLSRKNPVPASTLPQLNSVVLAIPVDEIEPYEKNPRHARNEAIEDLEASIRTSGGLDGIIQVMRQPGKSHYVCAKGANTRLTIIKKLWAETRESKYEQVLAQIVEWKGHAAAIADHVKENTLRGDMTYWDRALACQAIWDEAKAEGREFLGVKGFSEALRDQYGFPIDRPTLSRYLHCARHFQGIGRHLNAPIAKELVPTSNILVRLSIKFGLNESQAWGDLESALQRYADALANASAGFKTEDCIQALNGHVAASLGLTSYQLDFAVTALKADTKDQSTKQELLTTPEPLAPMSSRHESAGAMEEGALELAQARVNQSTVDSTTPLTDQPDVLPTRPPTRTVSDQRVSSADSPRVPQHVLDFDRAMEQVIDAASEFADLCDVSEHIYTGREYPNGFYVEIKFQGEYAECTHALDEDGAFLPMHVRQGAFWALVALSGQWIPDINLLLPAGHSQPLGEYGRWRKLWAEDSRECFAYTHAEGETPQPNADHSDVLHRLVGGYTSQSWEALVPVQLIAAVFEDPARAATYAQLSRTVAALRSARNARTTSAQEA